jgi:hypothetical protein
MLEVIHQEQFDLSYYVKGITFADTEAMSIFERKKLYGHLIKRKTEENDKTEQARKSMEANMSNKRKGSTAAIDAIQQRSGSKPPVRTNIGKPGDSKGYTI